MSERDLIERLAIRAARFEASPGNDLIYGQGEAQTDKEAAATIARLSEALAEAEKKGAEEGVAKCLEHIAYVRANIRVTPKDRVRFSVSDLNFAFRSALDVLKERITGEDEGKWHEEDATPPPRDLSQGGQP